MVSAVLPPYQLISLRWRSLFAEAITAQTCRQNVLGLSCICAHLHPQAVLDKKKKIIGVKRIHQILNPIASKIGLNRIFLDSKVRENFLFTLHVVSLHMYVAVPCWSTAAVGVEKGDLI